MVKDGKKKKMEQLLRSIPPPPPSSSGSSYWILDEELWENQVTVQFLKHSFNTSNNLLGA